MRSARKCPLCGHEFSDVEVSLRTAGAGWRAFWDRVALVFWAVAVSFGLVALISWAM